MRLTRKELAYCTLYQLAGIIRDEWEDRPDELTDALAMFDRIDDVSGEPTKAFFVIAMLINISKMLYEWNGDNAAILIYEIDRRIKEYEETLSNAKGTEDTFDPQIGE